LPNGKQEKTIKTLLFAVLPKNNFHFSLLFVLNDHCKAGQKAPRHQQRSPLSKVTVLSWLLGNRVPAIQRWHNAAQVKDHMFVYKIVEFLKNIKHICILHPIQRSWWQFVSCVQE
jgi:hypothetical protein